MNFRTLKPANRNERGPSRVACVESLEGRALLTAVLTPTIVSYPASILSSLTNKPSVGVKITNTGDAVAKESASVYMIATKTKDLLGYYFETSPTQVKLNLAPGKSNTFKLKLTKFLNPVSGSYYLEAIVITAGSGATTHGDSKGLVNIGPASEDISPLSVSGPAKGKKGKTFPFTVNLTNLGNTPYNDKVFFRLSFTDSKTGLKVPLTDSSGSSVLYFPSNKQIKLAANQKKLIHLTGPLPKSPGSYLIDMEVVQSESVNDPNPNNNLAESKTPIVVS